MAEEGEVDQPQQEDIPPGAEPGASRNSLLVSSDSYEELTLCLDQQLSTSPRKRLASGSINQIAGLPESVKQQGDSASTGTTSSRESSQRGTPCSEINAQDDSEKSQQAGVQENHVDTKINNDQPNQSSSETSNAESPAQVAPQRQISEEEEIDFVHTDEWKNKAKHVFILSEAGKPIYSRHGNEDKLVTIMGVMQALVSFVQDSKDLIRCIVAGNHKFVFLVRDHLILVGVSSTTESLHQILLQLNYVYNQVLSVLTYSQLSRIFKQRRNYDLRRLLTGAEKFLDNLLNMMDYDASFLLGAVRCLPLDNNVRDTIAQSIAQHAKVKDLVFAILIADNQLITLVRMKRYFLHPLDLHLVFNLVSASESFKGAESWTPICLPKFDSGGYLHAHISYLDEESRTCLLLLTVDRDVFFTLSECKHRIQQRLIKYKCLTSIEEAIRKNKYHIAQVGIPDLRHFLYKSRSTAQFTSPEFDAPYKTQEQQERIFGLYQYLHHRIHTTARPLKILFHVGPYETLLGWVTSGFELYGVFGPLVTKPVAISSVNKLLKWIKKEEDKLFILSSPTF